MRATRSIRAALTAALTLSLLASTALSLPAREPRLGSLPEPREPRGAEPRQDWADTTFLFAAEGPGSLGSPGTDERGFTFDGQAGEAQPAGWAGVDLTLQPGEYWQVAPTAVCSGHGTDMGAADPFSPFDSVNDFALWCGSAGPCGLVNYPGYGDNWKQYAIVDLAGVVIQTSLAVQFAYASDFEGEGYDFFEIYLDPVGDGDWHRIHRDDTYGLHPYEEIDLAIAAGGLPAQAWESLVFVFESDGSFSDADGFLDTDVGAVWLDNVSISADGDLLFRSDFEDGLQPAGLRFAIPPGAGDFAALYSNLLQDDPCGVNRSNAWAFFEPAWPSGSIPFGPPYVQDYIESPVLELDQYGQPLSLGADSRVAFSLQAYVDMPLDDLIFWVWEIGAVLAGDDDAECVLFRSDNLFRHGGPRWWPFELDVTSFLRDSAGGDLSLVRGIVLRVGVFDACPFWCDTVGSGAEHSQGPYIDTIRLMRLESTGVEWTLLEEDRFQDNFPEPGGTVRLDAARNLFGYNDWLLAPGDSTVVRLDMDGEGGVAESFNTTAGEMRPELRLWWRVVDGPHAGSNDAAMADPDGSDGVWSPWAGTQLFAGELWNTMQAEAIEPDFFAFDFADAVFAPGDRIEYFYRAQAASGLVATRPERALDADPSARMRYRTRCLPTPGVDLLVVDDGGRAAETWQVALAYNGYESYDVYTTLAPETANRNGLGGRAGLDDLTGYSHIIWDSGESNFPLDGQDSPASDTTLLYDWLDQSARQAGLWLLGSRIAFYLNGGDGSDFLGTVLGAAWNALSNSSPNTRVDALHPDLAYLGGQPWFWLNTSCPNGSRFDKVSVLGQFAEATHGWNLEGIPGGVAGILNLDPDGDGSQLNSAGQPSAVLYNPFALARVIDAGYGDADGQVYSRLFVGHALSRLLGLAPDGVAIGTDTPLPVMRTALIGAHPNPFNPSTTIRFSLAQAGPTQLRLLDVAGREVRKLWDGEMPAGEHEVRWDGRDDAGEAQASGVYLLEFRAAEKREKGKLILLK